MVLFMWAFLNYLLVYFLWSRFKYDFLNSSLHLPLKDTFFDKSLLKKKQLWYLFIEGLAHFKTIWSSLRDRLLLTFKSPGIPGSSFIETGKMGCRVNREAASFFKSSLALDPNSYFIHLSCYLYLLYTCLTGTLHLYGIFI